MTNAELSKTVEEQKNTINYLTNRVGELVDEMTLLKTESSQSSPNKVGIYV